MIKAIFDLYLIGNTCRSTMSEGIMRHLVKTKGQQDKVSTITCLVLVYDKHVHRFSWRYKFICTIRLRKT